MTFPGDAGMSDEFWLALELSTDDTAMSDGYLVRSQCKPGPSPGDAPMTDGFLAGLA